MYFPHSFFLESVNLMQIKHCRLDLKPVNKGNKKSGVQVHQLSVIAPRAFHIWSWEVFFKKAGNCQETLNVKEAMDSSLTVKLMAPLPSTPLPQKIEWNLSSLKEGEGENVSTPQQIRPQVFNINNFPIIIALVGRKGLCP